MPSHTDDALDPFHPLIHSGMLAEHCRDMLPGDMVAIVSRETGRLECLGVISAISQEADAIAVENTPHEFYLSGDGRSDISVTYTHSATVLNMKGEIVRPSFTIEKTTVLEPLYDIRPVMEDDLRALSERETHDLTRFWDESPGGFQGPI